MISCEKSLPSEPTSPLNLCNEEITNKFRASRESFFKLLPVRCGRSMKTIATRSTLHCSNRVGTGSARVALELIVCGECCIELCLLARIFPDIFDAVINLAGGQLLEQVFWHSHEEQTWKCFYEEAPDPRCHLVCGGFP